MSIQGGSKGEGGQKKNTVQWLNLPAFEGTARLGRVLCPGAVTGFGWTTLIGKCSVNVSLLGSRCHMSHYHN